MKARDIGIITAAAAAFLSSFNTGLGLAEAGAVIFTVVVVAPLSIVAAALLSWKYSDDSIPAKVASSLLPLIGLAIFIVTKSMVPLAGFERSSLFRQLPSVMLGSFLVILVILLLLRTKDAAVWASVASITCMMIFTLFVGPTIVIPYQEQRGTAEYYAKIQPQAPAPALDLTEVWNTLRIFNGGGFVKRETFKVSGTYKQVCIITAVTQDFSNKEPVAAAVHHSGYVSIIPVTAPDKSIYFKPEQSTIQGVSFKAQDGAFCEDVSGGELKLEFDASGSSNIVNIRAW
ncbi:MAG: hypothetical protein AAB834_01590 [Patescibacteria group bacterium]